LEKLKISIKTNIEEKK